MYLFNAPAGAISGYSKMENIEYEFTEEEMTQYRKQNYWRGFRACLILIVAPIVLIIIATAQIWVNANI